MNPIKKVNFTDKLKNMDANFAANIVVAMIIILLFVLVIYYWFYGPNQTSECNRMSSLYSNTTNSIKSLNPSDPNCQYTLKDYYIDTAYNCCSIGSIKNNYVNICALKQVIQQGVRGLDFEVYSINDQPVVATSTSNSNYVKETYNTLPFSQIMATINNYAFSSGTAPNPSDPIIMHLRIKSTNNKMYQNLANLFKQYDHRFLGPEFSYEKNGENMGNVPLLRLGRKIVLIVDKMNNSFLDNRDFFEYINMTSNSIFMHALSFYNVKNTPDIVELQDYNKQNMTIVLPDNGSSPSNPSPVVCWATGCQMIAMMYQNYDANLQATIEMFNQAGYAFALKPANLRYIPVTIPAPTPQNPALSYQKRTITSDYYSFSV